MFKNGLYECTPPDTPPDGWCPPQLCKYPEPNHPVKLLFLGWNPPKPFKGFWCDPDDRLRKCLHEILRELGQITAPYPDDTFLEEFLEKGFYFIHTVKCWTEPTFPGFGRDTNTRAGRDRREYGIQLIRYCVHTHLREELDRLKPLKVCALGKVPFVGLCELFPRLAESNARPTDGQIFQIGEEYEIPWPLLYTCLPQPRRVRVPLSERSERAQDIALGHIQQFLQLCSCIISKMAELTKQNQGYLDRLKRAKSWVKRADSLQKQPQKGKQREKTDRHGPFIFYWIAFNALYGKRHERRNSKDIEKRDRKDMDNFLRKICSLDQNTVYEILGVIKSDTDDLLKDKYLSWIYWEKGPKYFEKQKNDDYQKARSAYEQGKPDKYLTILFGRLRVLRNQIFHGCSTDRNSRNIKSLRLALEILEVLVAMFMKIFKEHGKNEDWGKIPYPRKGSPQHPGQSGASSSNPE